MLTTAYTTWGREENAYSVDSKETTTPHPNLPLWPKTSETKVKKINTKLVRKSAHPKRLKMGYLLDKVLYFYIIFIVFFPLLFILPISSSTSSHPLTPCKGLRYFTVFYTKPTKDFSESKCLWSYILKTLIIWTEVNKFVTSLTIIYPTWINDKPWG